MEIQQEDRMEGPENSGMEIEIEEIMPSEERSMATMEIQQKASFLKTVINLLNVLSGVGILTMPLAISTGGWLGLLALLVIAGIFFYTAILLKRIMEENPSIETYPEIGEHAYGSCGKILIAVFIYLEIYLVAVEFLILEGDNLAKLFHGYQFRILGRQIIGHRLFTILASIVILPTTWFRSTALRSYVSSCGVLASVIVVVSVFGVGVFEDVGFHQRGRLLHWRGIPTTFNLFAFCYGGHAIFPTLYNSMQDRRKFSKGLVISFLLSTINYGSMAIVGYLMFGDSVMPQVTLNLPGGRLFSVIAVCTTLINPIAKYGLMISPITDAIEKKFHVEDKRFMEILIRTSLLISTLVIALFVPLFGYMMSFIGAFLSVAGSIVIPCVCYLKTSRRCRRFSFEFFTIMGVLLFGIVIGIGGTCLSLKDIVLHLK